MATISKLSNPSPAASLPAPPSSSSLPRVFLGFNTKTSFSKVASSSSRLSLTNTQPWRTSFVVRCSQSSGNGSPIKRTTLHDLYEREGQSPWYDNLCRPVTDLIPLIESGVRGVTSNPAIFQKAISSSNAYNDQFRELVQAGKDIETAYWELVVKDIQDACKLFEPIYDQTDGGDGYVSVEVSPRLADDTQGTVEAAKWLHKVVDRPNVYIKIPATAPCIPSIKEVISLGISVNVTLIFSLTRYEAVIDAYLDGLEASGLSDLSRVTSVASFFVSRVDTLIDKMLEKIGTPEALDLRGKAAVAQAGLAYKLYQKKFSGPRWEALVKKGAKKQRLLWASTSVKNPAYPDTLYVAPLIGPDTVSTMPDQALQAFVDHGSVARTIDSNVSEAEGIYNALEKLGIDWGYVGDQLEFYGKVVSGSDGKKHWIGGEDIKAVAYDVPIPGYKTKTTINLRLWSTKAPSEDLDLYAFNAGDHTKAYEALSNAEKICYVLYPGDDSLEGKILRLKQQYTLCSASLQDIITCFERRSGSNIDWEKFPEKVAVQMNDTHPTLCIPELMRILIDLKGLSWKEAWNITQRTVAYTNHTVLPEALEKWSLELMQKLLPRHVEIIELIDEELISTIVSEYGTEDSDLLEKKLKEMRILENVDLPSAFAELIVKPKQSSVGVTSEELENSDEETKLVYNSEEETKRANDLEEETNSEEETKRANDLEEETKRANDLEEETNLEEETKRANDFEEEMEVVDEKDESKSKVTQKKEKIMAEPPPKPPKMVRMANLAVVGGHAVNGVAEIHSEIVKDEVFNAFYKLWPDKFQNKTNGVTPRRWIHFCNPGLSKIITDWIGMDDWVLNTEKLAELRKFSDNEDLQVQWKAAKRSNKMKVISFLKEKTGYSVSPDAMFDIQVKRIHEYKRQLLNILGIVYRYKKMKEMTAEERKAKYVPRVCIFGGKAFSTYVQAKRIVKFITDVGATVNHDPDIGDLLKVVFVPDYNVSVAELLIPASELSQHISTAGMEASGTSNMKFAMNGCVLIGTLDGANVEIREEVGEDNFFLFGARAHEIAGLRKERADGKFVPDPSFEEVKDFVKSGVFGPCNYDELIGSLEGNEGFGRADYFLVGKDFPSYIECQEEVDKAYHDQKTWTKMSIMNTAGSYKFSSDRTIHEYAREIWNIEPVELP